MAEFKLDRIRYRWQGPWVAARAYILDDVVSYEGKTYVCLVQHTADADFYTDFRFYNTDVPPVLVPRWELMVDGYVWTNLWQPDTFYSLSNIVRYRGGVYICISEHTSSIGANDFEVDVANWLVLSEDTRWSGEWTISTYYGVGDVVKYRGIIYRCITSHNSAATVADGLEDDDTKWEILSYSDSWRGNWTVSTRYVENDIVKYGAIIYRCFSGHTSASTDSDGLEANLGDWKVVAEVVDYKEIWAPATRYKLNDIVKYGSSLYKCNIGHTSIVTFEPYNWDQYVPGYEFDLTWNSTVTYQPGDVTQFGGYQFVSLTTNINSSPSLTSSDWSLLKLGSRFVGEWNEDTTYLLGDMVRRQGQIYVAVENSTGIDVDIADDGSTINSDYWELVIPGEKWQGLWATGNRYVIGDLVVWTPNIYRCIGIHTSSVGNRPDNDNEGYYWTVHTGGTPTNRLNSVGDLKTFNVQEDGSSIGTTRIPIGNSGDVLKVSTDDAVWSPLWESDKVYYVATNGIDSADRGTTINDPWKTVRYACENITGPASIFVKHGVYEEILPIRVPSGVAIIGDELRGTEIRPAPTKIPASDSPYTLAALVYLGGIIDNVVLGLAPPTVYSNIEQTTSGGVGNSTVASTASSLVGTISANASNGFTGTISGTNTPSVDTNVLNGRTQIINNKEFLIQEVLSYIATTYPLYSFDTATCERDLGLFIDAVIYDLLYTGNWKSVEAGKYYLHATNGDINSRQNMFLMRDATGLRNLSCRGLTGDLTSLDEYFLRRVDGGAYVSLDPGWGPNDSTTWITTRSPYIQNVTNFGTKCSGMKLDGALHAGGKKSMVANDFTQVLDDGIGAWIIGDGKTELVSVFTYYNYIGYLAEDGGRIRATNGNNSYGNFGSVALGSASGETPITAQLDNRYYQPEIASVLCKNGNIHTLFFNNAGVNYTDVNYTVVGSGLNANLTGNEFRDNGVYQARIVDRGDSTYLGGLQYKINIGQAQQGTGAVIRLAAANNDVASEYEGMRIYINSGTGIGQYGYVATFDVVSKDLTVAEERFEPIAVTATNNTGNRITVSDSSELNLDQEVVLSGTAFGGLTYGTLYYVESIISPILITLKDNLGNQISVTTITGNMTLHRTGWQNVKPGEPIEATLNTTTEYYIEPRVTFTPPPYSTSVGTMSTSAEWKDSAWGNGTFIAVATNTVASSLSGATWTTGTIPTGSWTSVYYGKDRFVTVSNDGKVAYSTTGNSWSLGTISFANYTSVTYGDAVDTWVAVAEGGTNAAYSTDDGVTWTSATLPEGADWIGVAYGNGKFVAVATSDSTATQTAYSSDGITWTSGSWIGGAATIKFGNGRFVALCGVGSTESRYSFDGITWYDGNLPGAASNWRALIYGQGTFIALPSGSSLVAKSVDGLEWDAVTAGTSSTWTTGAFGAGKFVAISGYGGASTVARVITAGTTAQGRAIVLDGKVVSIDLWEPGSGYAIEPSIVITDPNNVADVAIDVRTGNGVIAMPTLTNAGTGYFTESTNITLSGDGYADEYQVGKFLVVRNLTRAPRPGDNLNFDSIDDYTYRVLGVEELSGVEPNLVARLTIAKTIGIEESPEHNEGITIRQNYSQVRITGHDFLDIGLGNFVQTNYPNTLFPSGTVLSPQNEFVEDGGGRVFYTSTDQDGNFRCGELFAVEQSTGIVTLSADFFQLAGLEELTLGGISAGGTGVVIREFSTDSKFTADSNNIVPTQRAIKEFVANRVSGGGSDARTNIALSGIIQIGPDEIETTTGTQIEIPVKMNFNAGVDGHYLASIYFADSFFSGDQDDS